MKIRTAMMMEMCMPGMCMRRCANFQEELS